MSNINTAWNWSVNTCNLPNVGYSQEYREGQTHNGIVYYDCSSFIYYALKNAGFPVASVYGSYAWTTSDMCDYLPALGFHEVDVSGEWKPSDILWRSGHTEFVYQGRRTMGAHTDEVPLPDQVSVNSFDSSPSAWTRCFRYGSGASGLNVSTYVIAAICGNFWQESTVNPGLWQNATVGSPGYGLGQWTDNEDVHRRTDLFQWLDANGYQRDDGNGQLSFLIHENTWYSPGTGYSSLSDFLQSTSTDLNELTRAWMKGWEGISDDGSLRIRQTKAKECYDFITTHFADETITDWIKGNRYLADMERLNNAVMVYRWFSGMIPPEPPKPAKKKKWKWWLYMKRG